MKRTITITGAGADKEIGKERGKEIIFKYCAPKIQMLCNYN